MIYYMDDIPLDQQCLTFDGKQLVDGCSFAYYKHWQGINHLSSMDVGATYHEEPRRWQDIDPRGRPSETVRNVNAKIKQQFQLILDDQLMEDSRSLAYYNTENQSTLHLDLHFQGGMLMSISI
jgi:hypothetical protein